MLTLIANLGSTSFKFKLYDMSEDGGIVALVAAGAADRIGPLKESGDARSAWELQAGDDTEHKQARGSADLPDHEAAIKLLLDQLPAVGVDRVADIEAVGFKAVHGGPISGAVRVNDEVLDTMQAFADVAPAHNPPYIAAMKALQKLLPGVPQVAAFETAFHQTIPLARQAYATPYEWLEHGVRRYGFHGASNTYIAKRMAQVAPDARRIVNLHLGGSSSVTAIHDGRSVANSFGMTPQTGTFHGARVGDFDTFALLKVCGDRDAGGLGLSLDEALTQLGKQGGLLGLSGVSSDFRDVENAALDPAHPSHDRARLAIDAFVESCRHYLGAFAVALGGLDAVVFTGGIGQHGHRVRAAICDNLGFLGLTLASDKNTQANGKDETRIHADDSRVQVWVLPTNEEAVVARQTVQTLQAISV